ncbi:MAG: DEAD/DEAH box helicase family protein [candidate division Zixibacteria bacterium]|nr:DEAD/DEAH box helicase family protein [candidate division Zixibacteria bacterium]
MPDAARPLALIFAEPRGRKATERLLVVERFRLTGEQPVAEDSLIVPEQDDETLTSARLPAKIDRFFLKTMDFDGFFMMNRFHPSVSRDWQLVEQYLEKSHLLNLRRLLTIFFPTLAAEDLSQIRAAFSFAADLDNPQALSLLVQIITARAGKLPRGLRRRLKRTGAQASISLRNWIEHLPVSGMNVEYQTDQRRFINLDRFESLTAGKAVDPDDAADLLSSNGRGTELIDGFEFRRGQNRYAAAVSQALKQGDILLLEAATGTGKSIGYLLPTIATCFAQGGRAVVVTRTKSLQEQLFLSDLRRLRRLVPSGFKVSLLKGLGNYLCRLRFDAYLAEPDLLTDPEKAEKLMALLVWEEETKSGDLTETRLFADPIGEAMMNKFTLDESSCLGNNCYYYRDCYAFRARRQAARSNLVITNYALLFADLLADGAVLGKFNYAVLDEAHRLENEATAAFAARLPLFHLARLVAWGKSARFRRQAASLFPDDDGKAANILRALARACTPLVDRLKLLVDQFTEAFERGSKSMAGRMRFSAADSIYSQLRSHWQSNARLYNDLRDASAKLRDEIAGTENLAAGVEVVQLRRRLAAMIEYSRLLEQMATVDNNNMVMWGEKQRSQEIVIVAAPTDVGKLLADRLYSRYKAIVLTSATLDSEDDFAWISSRLGLRRDLGSDATRLKLGSPFPLADQLHIALASYLPPPVAERYPARLAQLIVKLRKSVRLSTLVLCTSYRMIELLAHLLEEENNLPGTLLVQRPDSSPPVLLTRFKQEANPMLIGTESFWEGVDLPEESLRLLILTRLPFPVPDDPLEVAKSEQAANRGENPFVTLSLPAAILKFRQGLGRVIRSMSDWGAVIITDSRMATKRYGTLFYDAAPAHVATYEHESILLKETCQWLYDRIS